MECVEDDRPLAQSQKYVICQDEIRHHVGLQAPLHSETLAAGAQTSSMVSVFPPILPSFRGMCLQLRCGSCCCGEALVGGLDQWMVGWGMGRPASAFLKKKKKFFNLISELNSVRQRSS